MSEEQLSRLIELIVECVEQDPDSGWDTLIGATGLREWTAKPMPGQPLREYVVTLLELAAGREAIGSPTRPLRSLLQTVARCHQGNSAAFVEDLITGGPLRLFFPDGVPGTLDGLVGAGEVRVNITQHQPVITGDQILAETLTQNFFIGARVPTAEVTSASARVYNPELGIARFRQDYLGGPFGGRDADLASLDGWLAQSQVSVAALLAPAGRGKSALVLNWVRRVTAQGRAQVVYYPISLRYGTHIRDITVVNLMQQLRRIRGKPATDLKNKDPKSLDDDLYSELRSPFTSDVPLVVVIDGLDELDSAPELDLVLPDTVGAGIRLLVTMRGDSRRGRESWCSRLKWHQSRVWFTTLEPLDRGGVEDVLRGGALTLEPAAFSWFSEQVYRLSDEGDPLLVNLWAKEIMNLFAPGTLVTLEDIKGFSLDKRHPGIEGYLYDLVDAFSAQYKGSSNAVQALLAALCVAKGPLSVADLESLGVDVASILPAQLPTRLRNIMVWDGEDQTLVFSHSRIGQEYASRYMSASELTYWKAQFIRYGTAIFEDVQGGVREGKTVPKYVLRYFSAHLADERSRFLFRLVDRAWMKAHFEAAEGSYDGFFDRCRSGMEPSRSDRRR